MTAAILVPSLGRPFRVQEVVENIDRATPQDHVQIWCAHGQEYREAFTKLGFTEIVEAGSIPGDEQHRIFYDDSVGNRDEDYRYVTRNNKLVRAAVMLGSKAVFFGQDDVLFANGWLEEAQSVMEYEGKEVVVVNDLHNPGGAAALMKTSYLDRAVFDSPGDAFHAGYQHNFADNEQHFTAMMRNTITRAHRSVVEHLNPIFHGEKYLKVDDTYRLSAAGWGHDQKLWQERRKMIEAALG